MGIVVVVKVTVTIISACSLFGVGPTITTTIIIIRSHVSNERGPGRRGAGAPRGVPPQADCTEALKLDPLSVVLQRLRHPLSQHELECLSPSAEEFP